MRIIPYLFISFLFFGCLLDRDPTRDERDIKIINKTKTVIYCLNSESDSFKNDFHLYYNKESAKYFEIRGDSFINFPNIPENWDNYIENCKDGKMRLFFIAKDSVEKHGWREVLEKNIYNVIYKIDINDLKKCNWEIVYEVN